MRTVVVLAAGTDPVANLALEARLLEWVPEGTCVLYLWQNAHTVVIGRNQNAWRECDVARLRADGGSLVRRLSGGGAVYHDLGNLNFTFLLAQRDYDLPRQQAVILRAVRSFGLDARVTGRNDLEIDGRKFSGNAYYRQADRAYHHGTLLLQADMARMETYLHVDQAKLAGKGVPSVRARVVNLCELSPSVTVDSMRDALIEAFEQEYGAASERMQASQLADERLRALEMQFASRDWIYGRAIPFTWSAQRRFPWGKLELQFQVNEGIVRACACYSDAMDEGLAARLEEAFCGCALEADALAGAIEGLPDAQVREDIAHFLHEQAF